MYRIWSLCDQPGYNIRNPLLSNLGDRKKYRLNVNLPDSDFYPVDANWWSDKVCNYSFCICNVINFKYILLVCEFTSPTT